MSSGVESESPVTSSRLSGWGVLAGGGVTGAARPGLTPPASKPVPESCWSGESQEVRSLRVSENGSWSETHPAGSPIALTMSLPSPGSSSSVAFRTAPPAKSNSSKVVSVTALTASHAVKRRRSQRSKRSIRLSSPCGSPSRPARASASISAIDSKSSGTRRSMPERVALSRALSSSCRVSPSESEVDEGWDALARHGRADHQDDQGEGGTEEQGLQPADPELDPLHRPLGQELQADHQRDRADDRD